VLEAAGPSPAVLVGHSWGGLLAQHAAWLRPDLIGGLLLVDPSDEGIWLDVLTADELRAMGEHTDPTRPASEDARAADLFTDADEISRDIAGRDPQLLELVTRASRSYLATDEQIRVHLDEPPMIVDGLDGMVRLRTEASWPPLPMVVLTATKERPARFTEPVVALHEEVAVAAAGRHVVVRDSGHYIQVDRPDLVIEQVREVCFANSDWT
jgi:pimeloyl-ACP methyl ester carboxylesterase